jgi:hypothetical protein
MEAPVRKTFAGSVISAVLGLVVAARWFAGSPPTCSEVVLAVSLWRMEAHACETFAGSVASAVLGLGCCRSLSTCLEVVLALVGASPLLCLGWLPAWADLFGSGLDSLLVVYGSACLGDVWWERWRNEADVSGFAAPHRPVCEWSRQGMAGVRVGCAEVA